jgi:carboxyl-terminal processing protease
VGSGRTSTKNCIQAPVSESPIAEVWHQHKELTGGPSIFPSCELALGVTRLPTALLVVLVACSGSASSGESSRAATSAVPVASKGAPVVATPPPDPREEALTNTVSQLLEKEHLLRRKIDDQISRQAFDTYVDRLDGGKMFLLQSDRDALAPFTDKIDDEMRSGNLQLAHEGAKRYQARLAVVEKMVAEILDKPFDFSNEEWIELDAEKVKLAQNDDELRDRWHKRLELEVLERVAGMELRLEAAKTKKPATKPIKDPKAEQRKMPPKVGEPPPPNKPVEKTEIDEDEAERATPLAQIPPTAEGREAKARADLAKTYSSRFARLKTVGPLDAAADVVNAVAQTLDPHTTYLPPAEKANFDIQMSGSLEGIGAVLREKDHLIEIAEIVPGGASWRQGGLAPGDLILSVQQDDGADPVDVFDMRIDEVVKMIRGKKGTVVRLRVQKPAGTEETVAITRDVIVIEAAYARGAVLQKKGAPAYGYVHLPSFYGGKQANGRSAAGDVRKLLLELKAKKVGGVILDLRSNGGGLLNDSIDLTGQFIDHGPVVQVGDSRGNSESLDDERKGTDYDGLVVVLVDQFSASASEIVAGALQDYKRALIVGTSATHGKGTVQTLADLDAATGGKIELGVLKLTIQQFFRPSGASTQRQGVVPDVVLPNPMGHIDSGERELPHAIEWTQIKPVPHANVPHAWKVADLAAKSAARVAKQPVLSKVATTTQLLRERQKDTRVPLQRTAWETRRKELKAALEAVSPELDKTAPTMTVTSLVDEAAPPPPAGGKAVDPLVKWRENLARDPWVDETVQILDDMAKAR